LIAATSPDPLRRLADVELGVGDDAALLRVPKDSGAWWPRWIPRRGPSFPRRDSDPRSIGHRALAVNLSDIAAMGATPAWATLALTLPRADAAWLDGFRARLRRTCDPPTASRWSEAIPRRPVDHQRANPGTRARGMALRRRGGKAGDVLAVTGTLGDAGAGLALLTAPPYDLRCARSRMNSFIASNIRRPRVSVRLSARGIASAAMDLSDGLVGDLPKLGVASGLAAHVAIERLPLSDALLAAADLRRHAIGRWGRAMITNCCSRCRRVPAAA
jgi:thiamine-monophosphate kinase